VAIKLYVSQANQGHNAGPGGYTEKAGMDAISRALAQVFERDDRFTVKRNAAGKRIDTASENGAEANAWGADYYVALHSNAGGTGARGTFGFYFSKSSKGYALAKAIVAEVSRLSPGKGEALIAKPGFIELHTPRCPACLIELEAHDWSEGVRFLTGQRAAIAEAVYGGICKGLGLIPVPPRPPEPKPSVDYRALKREAVKVGAALGIATSGVDATSSAKGTATRALLRAIADRKD
jgi:N-acetylmuramoyl-L-alanine amidase